MTTLHALVIDDDANNRGILAEMLLMEGITCTEVANPLHLPKVLDKLEKVDLIFLDLEMPGRNGYQVLESLRTDARHRNVPVVAYTVHVSEISNARKLGFHSFLGKPLDADQFPSQLARILKGESVWAFS